jgi:ubiquinone/menaquinone biosynthesis C-methylase UbiE
MNLNKRSYEKELMDSDKIDFDELSINLKELELINKLTGGTPLSFKHLYNKIKHIKSDEIHIVDIGFGAGDMLIELVKKRHLFPFKIRITALDIMPEAMQYVEQFHPELIREVNFVIGDYKQWFSVGNKTDIIHAGLFCHHFTDNELVEFFNIVKQHANIGAIINDLHRSKIAYYGIKLPTYLLSKSSYTKNDAPLSVLRGFKKNELIEILKNAGIVDYKIKWQWAFRYIIDISNKN